jgi:uncharacterized membrane protein
MSATKQLIVHLALDDRTVSMTVGAATVAGAVSGLVLGILISVTTDIPLAPEAGLVIGAFAGWLIRRDRG